MATNTPFRFLDLPGEIRNKIYRDTLVTSDRDSPITVTPSGYVRSGFLQACKQVHNEAFRIHQLENTFHIPIVDLDATPAMKLYGKVKNFKATGALHKNDAVDYLTTRTFSGPENDIEPQSWDNLMAWLQFVHSGGDFIYPFYNGKGPQAELRLTLDGMFQDAIDRRGMAWARVEEIFECMRNQVARADKHFGGNYMGLKADEDNE